MRLPTDDGEKNNNVRLAVSVLGQHLESRPTLRDHLARVLPVAAWCRFRPDGTVDPARDYRWNIEALVALLVDELPEDARWDFARTARVRIVQRRIAEHIVRACSTACGAVGAEPIPVADLPILTGIQTLMVAGVAYVAGHDLSLEVAGRFFSVLGINVGAAFLLREVVRALAKFLPGPSCQA